MLREAALFDALQSELAIVLEEIRGDGIDAERVMTRLLENDGAKRLLIGVTEEATAVLTYNRLMDSITRTPIEAGGLDGSGSRHIDRQRTDKCLKHCNSLDVLRLSAIEDDSGEKLLTVPSDDCILKELWRNEGWIGRWIRSDGARSGDGKAPSTHATV